ncbi:MAG: trigger factor [Desulfovibrio sp.]|nr:trigger factor [Desulfovibrio sp.]
MEHSVEELSPVKKKVMITAAPQEVEAAILGTIALYRTSVQIDGFRKGKVPASVIEKRYRQKIYEEARHDLINAHLNEVMQALDVTPVSAINTDGAGELERGSPYAYSIEFEVLPAFELPAYEGLEVDQEKVVVKDEEVDAVIERVRRDRAQIVPVDGVGPAVDGQIVSLDFAAYENGELLEGIKAENFDLPLGERQALEDFENLVKTIQYGQEGEGEISFPEDFLARDLAGKTVTMKVKVHAIKERKLPELNDDLAKSLGVDSIDLLKENIAKSYVQSRTRLNKGVAQKTLLDRLLKTTDFVLPESMVETQLSMLIAKRKDRMERMGKSLDSLGKSYEDLRGELLPQAEEITRSQVLLLAIANKEGLSVSEQEVALQIFQASRESGDDYKALRESYERSGMIFALRDHLLADKAMDAVYDKARVTEVDALAPEAASGE